MGGLRKSARKVTNALTLDPLGKAINKKIEDTTDKNVWGGPVDPENPNPELPKVIEMPDEDAIAKSRKRRASQRRGSAARGGTVLSDGLGG